MIIFRRSACGALLVGMWLVGVGATYGQNGFRVNPNPVIGPTNYTQGLVRPVPQPGFRPMPYPGYGYPYGPYIENPTGAALNGLSNVYGAQGQFMVNRSQSAVLDEQARQAAVDTRRKMFDEHMYEKSMTPTVEDMREMEKADRLRRSRNPSNSDIWSGSAMNTLLGNISKIELTTNLHGPVIPLEPSMVKRLNVTTGTTIGNPTLVKDVEAPDWPPALQGASFDAARETVDKELPRAVETVKQGGKKNDSMKKVIDNIEVMRATLKKEIDNVTPDDYMKGNRFLNQLSSTMKTLQEPKASNYLNGTWEAKGNTVEELLDHLTKQGLKFGPAAAGDENAYTAVYQAIAAYDAGLSQRLASR